MEGAEALPYGYYSLFVGLPRYSLPLLGKVPSKTLSLREAEDV